MCIRDRTQAERDAKAKELLTEAGYGPGKPLKFELLYNTDDNHKKVAVAVASMWKKLGVQVSLVNQEWKTYLETKKQGNFDVGRAGWIADYNEASSMLDPVSYTHLLYQQPDLGLLELLLGELVELADHLAGPRRVEAAARVKQLVIVIHQPDEAGEGGDLVALEPEGKTAAIEAFVMQMCIRDSSSSVYTSPLRSGMSQ